MILPEAGRGTIGRRANGGGVASLRKPAVYAARKLRRKLSLPEAMLWQRLRGKSIGVKVRRQRPIGSDVVDFYIREASLIIEVDGDAHNRGNRPQRDEVRETYLISRGHRVLRLLATDVLNDADAVVQAIVGEVTNPLHHAPDGPPPRNGEDL